jgi:hypothetical protein
MYKERPILFSTPMVQALDAGTKTQTRRTKGLDVVNYDPDSVLSVTAFSGGKDFSGNNEKVLYGFRSKANPLTMFCAVECPYGKPGDLLWVRETWAKAGWNKDGAFTEPAFKALEDKHMCGGWKPSIHMPKVAARIWLKITDIRVERLHDITPGQAIAEGIEQLASLPEAPDKTWYKWYNHEDEGTGINDPELSFFTLWSSINGKESLKLNPWVWVIEFEKVSDQNSHERTN